MKPCISWVLRATLIACPVGLTGACTLDHTGTDKLKRTVSSVDGGEPSPGRTDPDAMPQPDASMPSEAGVEVDAARVAPSSCRYASKDMQDPICRSYPVAMSEPMRRADCHGVDGTLSSDECAADTAVAYCDDAGTRDYVDAKSCAAARSICPPSSEWVCLHDDPNTLGNDRSNVVSCGETDACNLATDVCCVARYGQDDAGKEQTYCESGKTCQKGETAIPCDGAEDCTGGDVCCIAVMITILQQDATANGQCLPVADCNFQYNLATGQLELRVCHTDADCERGQTCKESGEFTWWGSCQ